MSRIIVYYKGAYADTKYIFGACGILKKNNLIVDMKSVKDERDKESGLRKIVYNIPAKGHLPSDLELEDIFNEMIDKCDLNIRIIKSIDNFNQKFQVTVRNLDDE